MTPTALEHYLSGLVRSDIRASVMLWGAPGIGKSSIVADVAKSADLALTDLRLSQLAPTDLRGLPVASDNVARWLPPEFLPRDGRGVLFLDELNMAPPTLQGIAQQLILDRRVGSYVVPDGWFIWAAGNRKEDHAAVFDMPAPLANRFLHLEVEVDFDSFLRWGARSGIHDDVLAFLAFRPGLLHRYHPEAPAWPSPRTWAMASVLHAAELSVAPAVGDAAAVEFDAYRAVKARLPDLEAILETGKGPPFPEEPSARYASVIGLATRAHTAARAHHGFTWLVENAATEWTQLFLSAALEGLRARGEMGPFAALAQSDERLRAFIADYQSLITAALGRPANVKR